jgi:hypothetical protein
MMTRAECGARGVNVEKGSKEWDDRVQKGSE